MTVGHEIIAPEVLPFEIGNAISAMIKRGRLSGKDGLAAFDEIQKIPVELRVIDLRKALAIASQHKIYAHDAYFLECAQAARCPLLILDTAMKKIAAKLGIALLAVET